MTPQQEQIVINALILASAVTLLMAVMIQALNAMGYFHQ
jgi:hypothetical protein